ncbi:MAG: OmpH family outer membrane protein [Ignavibacteria bacterium]|nr:OmpH family outer membrane protein [Ignavibacteria bacterium]
MKLKFCVLTTMLLTFVILAGTTYSQQTLKIAYVDSEVIIKQLPEYKKIMDELESIQKSYMDTINTKETEIKSKAEDFKTKYEDAQQKVESGVIKSDEELKALNQEINDMQRELQSLDDNLTTYKQTIREALYSKQSELFKPVQEKVKKAIEDLAKEMKMNLIFDKTDSVGALLYGDKELDLTFKVLDKLK